MEQKSEFLSDTKKNQIAEVLSTPSKHKTRSIKSGESEESTIVSLYVNKKLPRLTDFHKMIEI